MDMDSEGADQGLLDGHSRASSRGSRWVNIPMATVCIDQLADDLHVKVSTITKKLATRGDAASGRMSAAPGNAPPSESGFRSTGPMASTEFDMDVPLNRAGTLPVGTPRFKVKNAIAQHVNDPGANSTRNVDLERVSTSSDFTLGSIAEHENLPQPAGGLSYSINRCAVVENLSDPDHSSLGSIDSGPEVMFPSENDGLCWFEIPKSAEVTVVEDESVQQPILNRHAKLPSTAGALLGAASAGALGSWMQEAVPKLPTRTRLCIAKDHTGAAFTTIRSSTPAASPTGPGLKNRLHLPKLPDEVESLRIFQSSGGGICLVIVYNRPLAAWVALLVALLAEAYQTYLLLYEMRKPEEERSEFFSNTDVSVTQLWIMSGLFVVSFVAVLVSWAIGDFSDLRSHDYISSYYGIYRSVLLLVCYGLYTVPWTKHTAVAGSVSSLYAIAPIAAAFSRLISTRQLSVRSIVGLVILIGSFVGAMWLPYGMEHDDTWSYISVVVGSCGLALCCVSAKLVRPYMTLPALLLLISVGGFFGQLPFALSSDIDGNPAHTEWRTLFFGWRGQDRLPAFVGLVLLRALSLGSWCWCLLYLTSSAVVSALAGQRVLALAALATFHSDEGSPEIPARILPAVGLFVALLFIWSNDLAEKEKRLELQASVNTRMASRHSGNMNMSFASTHA